ncbi:transposase [Lewinella sp. W8]|uniref:transposase n=1 Tax=Lewinella sp. W8 TaxID=2528208 RepID=UPI001566CDC9|nr:transposase [Lewinella sp. W8]
MPQSYSQIILHTVFATKNRQPFLHQSIEQDLWAFMESRFSYQGCKVYGINGALDHVHIVHSLPRTTSIAKVVEDVKSISSKWIKDQGIPYFKFAWQNGYATFSVDYRDFAGLLRYLDQQKIHHYGDLSDYEALSKLTFEEEIIKFFQAYGIDHHPAYLFQ